MDPAGKELPDPPSHANTWISGADILQHIPELLVAETALEGHSEEHSIQAPLLANEIEHRQVLPSPDDALEHQGGEATDKSAEPANKLQEFKATETNEPEEGSRREDAADARQSEILDFLPPKDFSTAEELPPAKPPRQLTSEPDIVASTKKSGPTRPPPPASVPPPRPPPPARPAPPPRKKKSDLDIEVQKIPGLEGKFQFCENAIACEIDASDSFGIGFPLH